MKVVQITPIVGSGSVGRITDQLYKGLIENGHECKVIYGKIGNTCIPAKDRILTGQAYRRYWNALYARLLDRDGFVLSSGTRKIMSMIEEYSPDIIQMHGNYGYYIDIRGIFDCIKKNNYTVVNTLHSCWDFTGHCCYFTYANCDRWKTGCHHCPERLSYPASWFTDNSKHNYREKKEWFSGVEREIIVTPSEWLAGKMKDSFLSAYPVKVIRNGIDVSVFSNRKADLRNYGIDNKKIIILGVAGRWTPRKGLSDFIELAEQADDSYQIVVVGVSKRQKAALPANIVGITRTENLYHLAALYSASSVLFNPTYEDNYPTVNLESIACGTPVVTYETGGSPEIIRRYGAGKIINKKDYKALLSYARMYHKGEWKPKEGWHNDLSEKRMVSDYISVYKLISGFD